MLTLQSLLWYLLGTCKVYTHREQKKLFANRTRYIYNGKYQQTYLESMEVMIVQKCFITHIYS